MSSTRHVRTRTGCWTCRFRKKKCDEGLPACQQCLHLRLTCDGYEGHPLWMKDAESARQKKVEIKNQMVRRSRRRKKSQMNNPNANGQQQQQAPTSSGPQSSIPGHVKTVPETIKPPTPPATDDDAPGDNCSTPVRPRQFPPLSVPSSDGNEFPVRFATSSPEESATSDYPSFNMRQVGWSIDQDIPLSSSRHTSRTLSPTSTTAGNLIPPTTNGATSLNGAIKEESLMDEDEDEDEEEEDVDSQGRQMVTFQPPHKSLSSGLLVQQNGGLERDLAQLYLRTIFGVTYRALSDDQVTRYNQALIVPMFSNNPSFLHGCLSSTALHLTATSVSETQRRGLVTEVYRHRQKSLKSLKNQVANSTNTDDKYEKIKVAATICALISFEVFSRKTEWQVHVKAATDCIKAMDWSIAPPVDKADEWFVFCRILWLDILSGITTGTPPVFAKCYHGLLFLQPPDRGRNKLVWMTGCEDAVLYLISEITVLEHMKLQFYDENPGQLFYPKAIVDHASYVDNQLVDLTVRDFIGYRKPRSDYSVSNYDSVHTSPQPYDTDGTDDTDLEDDDFNCEFDDDIMLNYEVEAVERELPDPQIKEVVHSIEIRRNSSFRDGPQSATQEFYQEPRFPPVSSRMTPPAPEGPDVFVNESTDKLIEDRGIFVKAVTEAFRIMARAYLQIVVHGFNPKSLEAQKLLHELLAVIDYIPSLYMGFERSIISPLLIVGCLAVQPEHRAIITNRLRRTPHMAKFGNLGNVDKILAEVWSREWNVDSREIVPWRKVMREKGWEYLMV